MIQRIQSFYLLLAFLLGLISLFLPWVTYLQGDMILAFKTFSSEQTSMGGMLTSILVALFSALALIIVGSFKKRARQMWLIKLAMVLAVLVLIGFAFDHYQNIQALKLNGELDMNYGLPVIFPPASLILLWLAYRGVKKDEDLIKSVDRLR